MRGERNTAVLDLPIKEIIKEKEDIEQAGPIQPPRSSSEFQYFTIGPRINSIYYPFLQRFGNQAYAEGYDKIIAGKLQEIWSSLCSPGQRLVTLSDYDILGMEALDQLYVFRRRPEVITFLTNNAFLVPLIQNAHEQITKYFADSIQLILEVVTDPEIKGEQQLAIFVQTTLSPSEATKRLGQLDEKWWLHTPDNARRKLYIDLEFV